ncbi:MAG: PspA/IM30 family protein [Rhodobiaceae bacterium]|nr:PspA/IM30 family protein [Rhodobiaceae bacterium]MCC0040726.1 PspA/IM30 family protein [Rhodobiaceae bacterium]
MFKQIVTLFRGAVHDEAEAFTDRNALKILNQQIRDGALVVERARNALALAMAQGKKEAEQLERLRKRIGEMEAGAVTALETGKAELARETAEAIAVLEGERDTSIEAQERFSAEISRLRASVRSAEARLRELRRGQLLAATTDQAHKLRSVAVQPGPSALSEAEATLARLRDRQHRIDLTDRAMEEIDVSGDPCVIAEKLAAAGCTPQRRASADDLLERLKAKAEPKAGKA